MVPSVQAISRYTRAVGGTIDMKIARRALTGAVGNFRPDLVHALRIPYEGIIAGAISARVPLALSIWGNDLTLHAGASRLTGWHTRKVLQKAAGLICDCRRDLRLAIDWGWDEKKPSTVLASGGGVDTKVFFPGEADPEVMARLGVPLDGNVVFNPRGYRQYVRLKHFLEASECIVKERPDVLVVCAGLQGVPEAEEFVAKRGIADRVRLLPLLAREHMAELFRRAVVSVSPTVHDGSPNSLLEAMASGCYPVVGNIESVREWIVDGESGSYWDLRDGRSLADEVLAALANPALRRRAAVINRATIVSRASRRLVESGAEQFYGRLRLTPAGY
jgi:glycosyltransferase involved in cell wall biosynthesis